MGKALFDAYESYPSSTRELALTRTLALYYLYIGLGDDAYELYEDESDNMFDFFSIIAGDERLFLKHLFRMGFRNLESYLERIR